MILSALLACIGLQKPGNDDANRYGLELILSFCLLSMWISAQEIPITDIKYSATQLGLYETLEVRSGPVTIQLLPFSKDFAFRLARE